MKKKWYRVQYNNGMLSGQVIPRDNILSVWKDNKGHIEIARFKYGCVDRFAPECKIKEENIVAWKPYWRRPERCIVRNRVKFEKWRSMIREIEPHRYGFSLRKSGGI